MIESEVKTKTGTESITAYDVEEAPLPVLHFSKVTRHRMVYQYADYFSVLDTETAHDGLEKGWIYQWAVKIKDVYIYGRRPGEIIRLLERMRDFYGLHAYKKLIIYIHNMSYDMQYLKWYFKAYDADIKILATDAHKMLIVDVFGFRLLCSYRLTNLSLEKLSNDYAKTYIKASGAIDYDVIRYQDDILTPTDWYYMFSDVASQMDAITGYLASHGYDRAYKAPFTSTGFVRVNCRHASEKDRKWRERFLISRLDMEQFSLCRQAFMGGVTIASYQYAGRTVRGDIGHVDFTSSYPARQLMDYMPTGKPMWYGDIEDREELETLLSTHCCIFLLHMWNVQIKPGISAPYIPSSKCLHLENPLRLNGKLISADMLTIAVTEIDYQIIKRQYSADEVRVDHMLIFKRGPAPDWLKKEVMKYYVGKCTLKHSDPVLYMASKALLNGIYGMSATSPVRDEYQLTEEMMIEEKEKTTKEGQLNRFYASRNSFMPYQFGVYTTAHARAALMDMIETVGYDRFLYCDTDSVFYLRDEGTEERLAQMNAKIEERARAAGAFYGDQVLGVATAEPLISAFRALHAKCYAMVEDGELKVTIAGIPKKAIKWKDGQPVEMTNAEEIGEIDNLDDGFIFRHCGGSRAVYIERDPITEEINGHMTDYASSVIIDPIEKEINDTMYTVGKDYALLNINQDSVII